MCCLSSTDLSVDKSRLVTQKMKVIYFVIVIVRNKDMVAMTAFCFATQLLCISSSSILDCV